MGLSASQMGGIAFTNVKDHLIFQVRTPVVMWFLTIFKNNLK